MFKSATIFKITLPQPMLVETLEDAAKAAQFIPCGPTQERSFGWVPPRGHEHGAMVECIDGQLIMKLMIETKVVPTQAITDVMDEKIKAIEAATGRKPGKMEKRDLMDEVRLALLPHAFPTRTAVTVWIDSGKGLLVLDTASQSRSDLTVSAIVQSVEGIAVHHQGTELSPTSVMASWLLDGDKLTSHDRFGFDIGRACELKACDESKAVVRYTRHNLDNDEIKDHITGGKMPTKLALTYNDRVSFVLNSSGVLTNIEFLDDVFLCRDKAVDNFDADVAIATAELGLLINDMTEVLGGEVVA